MSNENNSIQGAGAVPKRNRNDVTDAKLSLMNEIEMMISKSVKNMFENEMKTFMNDMKRNQNTAKDVSHEKPCSRGNNIERNLEFPKSASRHNYIKAGEHDIFADDSPLARPNINQVNLQPIGRGHGFAHVTNNADHYEVNGTLAHNNANIGVSANAPLNSNDLILRMLQREFEEKKERKFERELNKIPEFSGDSKKNLDRFITAASIAYNKIANQEQCHSFYDEILRKTSGSALSTVERMTGARWSEIESALRRRFAYLTVNSDVLRSKIDSLRQNKSESIHDFAKRTRNLVNERIKSYDGLTADLEHEIERSALKSFQRGISNEKIRERVINMGAHNLDRAFQNAFEIEADMSFEVNKRDFYCKNCQTTGHKTSDCRKNDQSDIARLTGALEKMASFKKMSGDFYKQSNKNNTFSGRHDLNQGNWRKNGNQNKTTSSSGPNNGTKAIHCIQDGDDEISEQVTVHEENGSQSDSSENSNQ